MSGFDSCRAALEAHRPGVAGDASSHASFHASSRASDTPAAECEPGYVSQLCKASGHTGAGVLACVRREATDAVVYGALKGHSGSFQIEQGALR